jgi:chromate transporter
MTDQGIPLRVAARVWARVAALSFGGPAGQIAVMQRILVEEKRWISQGRFLHALNYCTLLPGPEAQQLATYVGWLLNGTRGGLVAGSLFVLPGFLALLGLSIVYARFQGTVWLAAVFFGLKPAVLAVVVEALWRIARRALHSPAQWLLATGAFVALFVFAVPFPAIVFGAALVGWLGAALGSPGLAAPAFEAAAGPGDAPIADRAAARTRPSWRRTLATVALWLTVWWVPIALLAAVLGPDSLYLHQALFFSQVAVVSFGGAYAVLAYVAQRAVADFGWLSAGEMLDGLGMAETTPGPLIMVLQFVGFLAAWRQPAPLGPLAGGLLASLVVVWVTFAPCFLWIFVGAPYVEWLRGRRRLASALAAITAAVVGVILNLAMWFALHVLFGELTVIDTMGVHLTLPLARSLDPAALVLTLFAFLALFRLRWGMLPTLASTMAAGAIWRLTSG